ncbi:MAG: orotidine-5'-phosphate decarboxylase [Verrucomicrobiaceae bacterium]|jgi:orotidine-5'-phosphate decarboxylase|nr:orotidine-5'-phosphate decarboxylase [Verrucomicrobiaceae bacterium]
MSKHDCKLMLALDLPDRESALEMLNKLRGSLEWVKIGLQMYLKYGASFVREVADMGFKIFLDLKLHDIPNTVASAVKSLQGLPISMLTIHTCGGREMMMRALEAASETNKDLRLLGVTVLTSFNDEGLAETGVALPPAKQVELLAKLATDSGMKGLVCSPLEIETLRKIIPSDVILVTPGIRPAGSDTNEQKRVMTPEMAAKAGSNFIVVGRPILKAENPAQAAKDIIAELENCNG